MAAFDIAACVALMDDLTAIATRAAAAIQEWGASSLRHKADGSPVTAADEASEAIIFQGLENIAPGIPIVSEERSEAETSGGKGRSISLSIRSMGHGNSSPDAANSRSILR